MTSAANIGGLLFNGAVDIRATEVITCESEAAVVQAVRNAAWEGAPLAVVAGGHDLWGRGFTADNRILDLTPMDSVSIAPTGDAVTVSGRALIGQLVEALPERAAAVVGNNLSLGAAGFILGGGYGQLTARYGLAVDNLLSARVVLADGSVVVADAAHETDLFWALRGGGSGFGVVTSATLALHALPQVLSATVLTPLDRAAAAVALVRDLIAEHPIDLGLFSGFMTAPDGRVAHFAAPLWTGDPATGEAVLDRLAALPEARVANRRWSSYRATFDGEAETAPPKGAAYRIVTRTVRHMDDETIDVLIEAARAMPAPTDVILMHDFHGAATRIGRGETAFPLREPHVVVEAIAITPAGSSEGDEAQRGWVDAVGSALSERATPGGYVALLGPGEGERVRAFYGAAGDRLRAIKRRVDPHDLFRAAIGRLA